MKVADQETRFLWENPLFRASFASKHTRLSNRDAAADAIQQNNLTERVRALLSGEGTDDDGEQGEAEAAEEF